MKTKMVVVWIFLALVSGCEVPEHYAKTLNHKVLNNFVTELLNIEPEVKAYAEYDFYNPRQGWVYFSSTATSVHPVNVRLVLDKPQSSEALFVHKTRTAHDTLEAMRWLAAGDYKIKIWTEGSSKAEKLIVRAVPRIMFSETEYDPWIKDFGPYTWEFLRENVLGSFNEIMNNHWIDESVYDITDAQFKEWHDEGKKWFQEIEFEGRGKGNQAKAGKTPALLINKLGEHSE